MARMRRINIVIDPELDDRLEREAAARGTSKSALVRDCVDRGLRSETFDNGLRGLPVFAGGEPDDSVRHNDVVYG
jgi:predicted transcriptional regulator